MDVSKVCELCASPGHLTEDHYSVMNSLAYQTYGEQVADTDGLAAIRVADYLTGSLVVSGSPEFVESVAIRELRANNDKLTLRAEAAERNLEATIRERDALRAELNLRMAMPARALTKSWA